MKLLATLRPPTRDEWSRAYRERIPPPPAALASLLEPADDAIAVEITPEEIRVLARADDDQMDAANAAAVRALQVLQVATGWYVFGPLEDGFQPTNDCPACSIERFAWQKDEPCPACGEAMRDEPVAEAKKPETKESVAEALVDTLLENEWLELVSMSSRKALVRDIAEFLHQHPRCREPVDPAAASGDPARSDVRAPKVARRDDAPAPPVRTVPLSSLAPAARAAAIAEAAASTRAAVAARAARSALLATARVGSPGFDLLDRLTDLPYVAEVYADEDELAALLRGS